MSRLSTTSLATVTVEARGVDTGRQLMADARDQAHARRCGRQ